MDKWSHPLWSVGLNYLSIPILQRLHRWSLGMDKLFHLTLFWTCDYSSMLRLRVLMMAYKCTSKTRHNLKQWWLNVNTILENKFNHFSVEMLFILIKTTPFENYMFKAMVTYPHSLSHGIRIIEIYFVGVFCCNVLFIIFIGICGNNQSSWFHQSCMQCGFYFRHTWVPEGKTSFFSPGFGQYYWHFLHVSCDACMAWQHGRGDSIWKMKRLFDSQISH